MFSPYFGGASICSLKFDANGLGPSFRFLQIAPQITPHGSRKSVYLADEENAEMKNAGTCRQTRTQPVPGKKRCTQCTGTHSPEISFGHKKKSQSQKMKSVENVSNICFQMFSIENVLFFITNRALTALPADTLKICQTIWST